MKRVTVSRVPNAALSKGEVHVWHGRVSCASTDQRTLSVLSDRERTHLSSLGRAQDKVLYAAAHTGLRTLLSMYSGLPTNQLQFTKGRHGKPSLVAGDGLRFNLSHSGDRWVVAIGRDRDVGVDVEKIRQTGRPYAVANRFFAPGEQRLLADCPPDRRLGLFFHLWCLKEAYIKALGLGLAQPLDAFAFGRDGDGFFIQTCAQDAKADWTAQALDPACGYKAAVVVRARRAEISQFNFETDAHAA